MGAPPLAEAANKTAEEAKGIAEEVKEDAKWHAFGLALSVAIVLAAPTKSFGFFG